MSKTVDTEFPFPFNFFSMPIAISGIASPVLVLSSRPRQLPFPIYTAESTLSGPRAVRRKATEEYLWSSVRVAVVKISRCEKRIEVSGSGCGRAGRFPSAGRPRQSNDFEALRPSSEVLIGEGDLRRCSPNRRNCGITIVVIVFIKGEHPCCGAGESFESVCFSICSC
jgi:hypothetical protein